MPTSGPRDVRAAGAVVFRPGRQVLLVHRPAYDDWSFPKGKLDRGEHAVTAAVREVEEETGLRVRLGPPLASQRYPLDGDRAKTVDYWTARVRGDDDVSRYAVNREIDQVAWVDAAEALERLTYLHDRDTLHEALGRRRRTTPLLVLRHAKARSRRLWRGDDAERPLLAEGQAQSVRLVPLLASYGVERVVASTSLRCLASVAPYAAATGAEVAAEPRLSEAGASRKRVRAVVREALEEGAEARAGVLLCSHRPVLPHVLDALGLEPDAPDEALAPAELLVVHHRSGRVVATERHRVR